MKVAWETRKIFGSAGNTNDAGAEKEGQEEGERSQLAAAVARAKDLKISCTAVRVPTFRAHAETIILETEKEITVEEARAVLENSPGVVVVDDVAKNKYPMPLSVSGRSDEGGDTEDMRIYKN